MVHGWCEQNIYVSVGKDKYRTLPRSTDTPYSVRISVKSRCLEKYYAGPVTLELVEVIEARQGRERSKKAY